MLDIGSVLKKARLEKGMTLEDLSSRCGYSKALISRIENNSVSPSIGSLTKISEFLDLKLYNIFSAVEVDEPQVLKKEKRQRFSIPDADYEIEFLTTGITAKTMQPFMLLLNSGNDSHHEAVSHKGEEFMLVLQGAMEVYVGDHTCVLRAGDSIYFKSSIPHKLKNVGKTKGVSLTITSPPYY